MIERATNILGLYREHSSIAPDHARLLEIGAGRDLITAICLRAMGVKEVVATDVNNLARLEYVNHSATIVEQVLGVEIPSFNTFKELENYGVAYHPDTKVQSLTTDRKSVPVRL